MSRTKTPRCHLTTPNQTGFHVTSTRTVSGKCCCPNSSGPILCLLVFLGSIHGLTCKWMAWFRKVDDFPLRTTTRDSVIPSKTFVGVVPSRCHQSTWQCIKSCPSTALVASRVSWWIVPPRSVAWRPCVKGFWWLTWCASCTWAGRI